MSLIIEGRVKTVDSERQATAETHLSGKSNGGGSEMFVSRLLIGVNTGSHDC